MGEQVLMWGFTDTTVMGRRFVFFLSLFSATRYQPSQEEHRLVLVLYTFALAQKSFELVVSV